MSDRLRDTLASEFKKTKSMAIAPEVRDALIEYASQSPETVFDLAELLKKEIPEEAIRNALTLIRGDKTSFSLFHQLQIETDLQDISEVGDLLHLVCALTTDIVNQHERLLEKTPAYHGGPEDPESKYREVDRDFFQNKERLGLQDHGLRPNKG